ncbi:MAG: hypothetical protein HZB38_08790 [Planctomycetes bacterium]|nr:hypothetical protein [Planctomycetota bacterium]
MLNHMTAAAIRELLDREPFHPFRVRASSGAAYDVRNPGLVVVLKSQLLIAEPKSDRYSLIPFLHVAGIELISNGHPHPSRKPRR